MSITTSAPARSEPGLARPASSLRGRTSALRELARTTRVGRLATAWLLALVLVLLAGVLGLAAVLRTDAAASAVVERGQPVTAAAQELFRALSSADAAAAQGFLAGEREPAELREQYQADVTEAGAALAAATRTGDAGSTGSTDPAQVIATGLPVYTGLVETARAADRQRLAVGAAYLREASSFLQTTLLPAARQIYEAQAASLDEQQDVADGGPLTVLALVATVAALVAVVALHRRIARTTKRRVTPGVVLGAGALALMLVWGAAALATSSLLMVRAHDRGSVPDRAAVDSRFSVLQSRSDDVLTLIARGGSDAYERQYTARSVQFLGYGGQLEQAQATADPGSAASAALASARTDAYAAVNVHNLIRSLDVAGNYDEAVATTLSTDPAYGGRGTVTRTEGALGRAIDATAAEAAGTAADARAATTALSLGVVVLTLVALVGVAVGVWPRLQEYR